MQSESAILAFASQILAFIGFLTTSIAVIRYLNPRPKYIVFANLVGEIRQIWLKHESQAILTDNSTTVLLSILERYADLAVVLACFLIA
jgi:hypothetical protein